MQISAMNPSQHDQITHILSTGTISVVGQFMWGSNYTFLSNIETKNHVLQAVYKPTRGERPLWDFPHGTLAAREVAAYVTSRALGWNMVPPTIVRQDGPAGSGSLQLFVDIDPERYYFTFSDDEKQRLRPVVLLDLIINNADRKGGHIILAPDDHLWLIDHGLCFHHEYKLRTVVWDFINEPIPEPLQADLQAFLDRLRSDTDLRNSYAELLSPLEIDALMQRTIQLLEDGFFPGPGPGMNHPWPLV
jgi:uncharacterized repeat protein (TIGR03843 family)